jgi:hypothetical protein
LRFAGQPSCAPWPPVQGDVEARAFGEVTIGPGVSGGVPFVAANYRARRGDQLATIRPEGDTFQRVVS